LKREVSKITITVNKNYMHDIVLPVFIVWIIVSILSLTIVTIIVRIEEKKILFLSSKMSVVHNDNGKCVLCGMTGAFSLYCIALP